MNREKIFSHTADLKVNYARYIYLSLATLATAMLQTIAISVNSALAVDGILDDLPLTELTNKAKQSRIPAKATFSFKILPEEEVELPKVKKSVVKLPELIAQTDSSGFIGDSLSEVSRLRQELLIEPLLIGPRGKAAPASSAGTPTGYGASWRQAYVGVGFYFPFGPDYIDGSAALGFGVGDAVKSVGVEFNIDITSLGRRNFDFGASGIVGFKVHKYFSDGTAVAVGWANPITWGNAVYEKDTVYGVVTKAFDLQPNNPNNTMPLTISLGVGSGSFRSVGAIKANDNAANFFGSIGLRIDQQISLVSSWTGNRLNLGASFTPFRKTPLVVNAIFTDITNNIDKNPGLSVSAGYVFQF